MTDDPRRGRRALLAGLTGTLAGLAGCGGLRGGDDGTFVGERVPESETDERTPVTAADTPTVTPGGSLSAPLSGTVGSYHYDGRNSGATAMSGPAEDPRVVLRARLDGVFRASPVVAEGVAYFGGLFGALHAVDTGSAEVLWSRSRGRQFDGTKRTPAVADGVVYHATRFGEVVARTLEGRYLWSFTADDPVTPTGDPDEQLYGTAPTVADGTVFVNRGDGLFAVDAADGAQRWKIPVSEGGLGAPAVADGRVFYARTGGDGRVVAADAATGEALWDYVVGYGVTTRPVTVADGTVYAPAWDTLVDSGREGSPVTLVALDAATGAERWRYENGALANGPVALGDDRVYVAGTRGGLSALARRDGAELWSRDLGRSVVGPPVVADGVVYAVTVRGRPPRSRLVAVDPDGTVRWGLDLGADTETGPVVLDGHVLVPHDQGLVVVG